jgi:hypothetical protein
MNTLTENELTELSASGDGMPEASWPTAGPLLPALNLAWLNWLLASNNLSEQHMAD